MYPKVTLHSWIEVVYFRQEFVGGYFKNTSQLGIVTLSHLNTYSNVSKFQIIHFEKNARTCYLQSNDYI